MWSTLWACVSVELPVAESVAVLDEGRFDLAETVEDEVPWSPLASAAPEPVPPVGTVGVEETGVVYELYVRSFQDSDGDGIGDFEGVRSRLDHLEGLGVDTLWLMPVFPAFGPAGYDVTDFASVTAEYGTTDDLRRLTEDAHALGIRVILDLPLNHVHVSHPWFVDAVAGVDQDRFLLSDTQWDVYRWHETGTGQWFYGFFGDQLPDLDWRADVVRDEMFPVLEAWVRVVDGYRLDAAITLVETTTAITSTEETHDLLAELRGRLEAANPNVWLLAEVSETDIARSVAYLGTEQAPEADAVLDFPRHDALMAAIDEADPALLVDVLSAEGEARAQLATFPSSHDMARLHSRVEDEERRRALWVLTMLLPGHPVVYYGEELDLPDTEDTGQDYVQRAPMPWTADTQGGFTTGTPWFSLDASYRTGTNVAEESADPTSMLSHVRSLASLRRASRAASDGPLTELGSDGSVVWWTRQAHDEILDVMVDTANGAFVVELDGDVVLEG